MGLFGLPFCNLEFTRNEAQEQKPLRKHHAWKYDWTEAKGTGGVTWIGYKNPRKTSSLVDADGVIKLTPEEEAFLLKICTKKLAAEKGKTKDDQDEKEAEPRAKIREADTL
ncbi:hypothetical protein AgCh_018192 [Apium graveolens]